MILSIDRTLIEDLNAAKKEGYSSEFIFRDEKLHCRTNKKSYTKEECILMEYCRHEGMNDPSDSSILFLIKCNDGTKGCLTSAYGIDADTDLIEFVMSLPKDKT